jgi:hypothetical protein
LNHETIFAQDLEDIPGLAATDRLAHHPAFVAGIFGRDHL